MATSIPINPDVASLKKAFAEIRNEAKLTQAAINSGLDTSAAAAKLDKLRVSATSLKQALDKVGDKTKVDVDVKGAESELDRLQKKVESVSGGKPRPAGQRSPAITEEQRLHAIRKNHAQIESGLKRRLQDQQTRDAERAFKNYQRFNPHLRQFGSFGDFLERGKAQYGGDFGRIRRETLGYVQRRAGIGGGDSPWPGRLNKLAGAAGGIAGGFMGGGLGSGGAFGTIGTMAGSGIGAGIGSIPGTLGRLGGPIGALAGMALSGIGSKLDKAMDDNIAEGLKSSNLTRSFGSIATGFDQVRDASRDAAKGMQLSYEESAQFASMFAQKGAMRSSDGLRESLTDAYGFGRSLGVGNGAGVSFMASLRGTGAAGDEKSARRVGLSVAEAIQKGGLGPQANQVLTAIEQFATASTQTAFRAPDVGGFASMMAAGNNLNLAGLNAGTMGSIIQKADAAVRQGGNMGMASQMVTMDTIAQLDPRLNAMEAKRVQEGGFFGTIGGAFGENSAAVKEAQARLKRGDKSAQGDLDRYAELAGGKNANARIGPALIENIVRNSGSTAEAALSVGNTLGVSTDQASTAIASINSFGGTDALMKRLGQAGLNIDKLNPTAYMEMTGVAGADRSGLDGMADRLKAGKDFKPLDKEQSKMLQAAIGQGDEQLRNVLLQILDKTGGQLSEAERAQQTQQDMRNAAVRLADGLLPITNDIKSGIGALVEKLAPDTAYGRSLRAASDVSQAVAQVNSSAAADTKFSSPGGAPYIGARGLGGRMVGNAPSILPSNLKGRAQEAFDFFVGKGWSKEQAAGMAANLSAESKFNHQAVGDGGRAFGIAQWHPDRQAEFEKFSGKNIRDSSFQEQLAFMHHELTAGKEKAAGDKLKGSTSAAEAGAVVSRYYERPADALGQATARARDANSMFSAMSPDRALAPDRVRVPEFVGPPSTPGNGKLEFTCKVIVTDEKGRPRNDVRVEVTQPNYQPMPAGVG